MSIAIKSLYQSLKTHRDPALVSVSRCFDQIQDELDRLGKQLSEHENWKSGVSYELGVDVNRDVETPPGNQPGRQWAPLIDNLSVTIEYVVDQVGGLAYRFLGTYTPPTDSDYRGLRALGEYGGNQSLLSVEPRESTTFTSRFLPVPDSPQVWTIYAQSIGPNSHVNDIVPGVTPSVTVTVQDQAGLGGLDLRRVDTTSFDPVEFQLDPVLGIFEMRQIHAGKIQLDETLRVGGGASQKVGKVGVFDNFDQMIGWIGKMGSYVGGWFRQLYVGGADPATSPFRVDSSGNVVIDNTATGYSATFVLNLGGVITQIKNSVKGSYLAGLTVSDAQYCTSITQAVAYFGTPSIDLVEVGCFSPTEGFLRIWNPAHSAYAFLNHYHLTINDGASEATLNPTSLSLGGNQVVTTRLATVSNTSRTAGASYTANEQAMLNELKGAVDGLINRLKTHGLIA